MANYALTVNSTFQPFTYQELAAPLDRQELYHEKLAEEYDKLSTQADVLEAMGANDMDKESGAYSRYKSYSSALRKEADDLYRFGLNTESRQRLTDLRRRYNTDIVPIQNAWNKRAEESKMQLTASMQNPDLRFTRDARNTSLDDYIRNPQGGYGVVNLRAIYSDMSALANNLSKLKRAGRKEGIDSFTYNLISQYGLDPNLVNDWVNNPNASPTLTKMMNQVLAKYGVNTEEFANTPNGASILNEAIGAAQMGAWSAVGEDKEHILEKYETRLNAQAAKELSVAREKAAMTGGGGEEPLGLPGSTVKLNFNDPESAGMSMKRRMAEATADYLRERADNKDPLAKMILDKGKRDRGSIEALVDYWATNGIDGNEFKWVKDGLNNYLRSNVTQDNDLINIWSSDYGNFEPSYTQRLSSGAVLPTGVGFWDGKTYKKDGIVNGKDWDNFNDLSSNGYYVNYTALDDDPTILTHYLSRVLSRLGRNSSFPLYDIKKIDGKGEYTYSSDRLAAKDLPHTSNGKEIDYSKIHRGVLSNGDYLLYWLDDSDNTVEKVLKKEDISEEELRDWNNAAAQKYYADNLLSKGLITEEDYEYYLMGIKSNSLRNNYLGTQEADVQTYKIK